ncbi:head-tail adaptor protein [Rhodobacteraceae bacterium CCMM004]|nr:head-tail adaptor protein [Rhodobacteraceae bacterium CCMM004]
MTAPRLTRPLVLEAPQRVPDGAGGYAETWAALGTLWAEVKPASGGSAAEAGAELGRLRLRITVRAAPLGAPSRPMAGQRFRDGARAYAIRAVHEADPGARYLRIWAEEEVAT